MMRLPEFRYCAARSIEEAAAVLAESPADTMLLAGGTDVLPNMKRRQQVPRTVVGLRGIPALGAQHNGNGLVLGAGVTLTHIVRDPNIRAHYPGLWQAAAQIATPHLRNMGTIGGNLCLDTRCTYYDQNYEWRKAIDFCLKKDGAVCWVATSSPRCLAVSSTDTAPALIALRARVRLVSANSVREVDVTDLYQNDGIQYSVRRADEILTEIALPPSDGWRSTYWKLRRRGSFDFPVLSVAGAVRLDPSGGVTDARIVLGAVASRPMEAREAASTLVGRPLSDEAIAEAAEQAFAVAKPMDNTDFTLHWRKRVSRAFVTYALRELRGDDMRDERVKTARQAMG
ncbi:MAG TPA: FAD binding domain-containing protein [Vicinamibacterales bacterium]|jgi:4-hydroxybenzoyl-CoA reductase subunit beta